MKYKWNNIVILQSNQNNLDFSCDTNGCWSCLQAKLMVMMMMMMVMVMVMVMVLELVVLV